MYLCRIVVRLARFFGSISLGASRVRPSVWHEAATSSLTRLRTRTHAARWGSAGAGPTFKCFLCRYPAGRFIIALPLFLSSFLSLSLMYCFVFLFFISSFSLPPYDCCWSTSCTDDDAFCFVRRPRGKEREGKGPFH